jgi:methyltransferase (TIGR00027 family)
MAKSTVSHTALGAGVCRLIEQYQPDGVGLFDDPVIADLIGQPIKGMMNFASLRSFTVQQTESVAVGIYGAQVCRTRYIDQVVLSGLEQSIKQVVILGAGLDSRAYRLPGIEQARVYELDLPAAQQKKRQKLEKHFGQLPDQVTFLSIDFEEQSLDQVFDASTFDRTRPAVFVWEAVTQYLSEQAVRNTLSFVGKSAPGSLLVFTYVLRSIVEGRSDIISPATLAQIARDSPWIFGLEPAELEDYLQPFHLTLVEDVGNAYYQEHYLKPVGRKLVVSEGERIALAKVA